MVSVDDDLTDLKQSKLYRVSLATLAGPHRRIISRADCL